ncbi:MAG: polysaccharide biosynthesis protein [Actinomycetia bacterium]|nr:polysaccharide biosynthesis protein [Actinomycetes bacterium]
MNLSGRIAANSFAQICGNVVASLVSFFTFAAVTRALGPGRFGDLVAATAFLGIPILIGDLGLSWGVLREISQYPERTGRVMGASVLVRTVGAAVIVSTAAGIAFLLPFNGHVRYAVAVGAIGAFFNLADLSLMPALQAQLRMYRIVLVTVVSRLVTLALVFGFVAAGLGFHAIVWAYALGNIANFSLDLLVVRRLVGLRLVFDLPYCWKVLRGSLLLGAAYVIGTGYWYVDRVLLSLLAPSHDVGLYGAAFKFIELSFIPITAISISIFPSLARSMEQRDLERTPHLLQRSLDIMVAMSVPLCVFALVDSRGLVTIVGGSAFSAAAPALQILGPLLVVVFVASVFERGLIAGHRERLLLLLNSAGLALNVVLNVLFIPRFGYKAVAAVSLLTVSLWVITAAILVGGLYSFRPRLQFVSLTVLAGAVMAAALTLLPGPQVPGGLLALVVYVSIVVIPPGTGRELAGRLLVSLAPPRPAR